jgi:multiple sugar transport system ATP-binding protein
MADLELSNVVKRFGSVEVIHGVDLKIRSGEFVVFVGPSGCGKSTLLRMIAGLEAVSGGAIAIDGATMNEVPAAKRGLAMVFQSYALYPHMSVRKNLSFGLETMRAPKAEITQRVAQAAEILQIGELLERKPGQLSGGQRQRVAIGRAIVREPKIFLFDEPLSNLDAELRMQMRVEINKLHRRLGSTMIFVTHDQVEAMTLADRIVVLRAGVIEQVGTPLELYNDPQNLFVAGFIGSPRMNFLPGAITGANGGAIDVRLDTGLSLSTAVARAATASGKVTLGIRPEDITVAAPDKAMLSGDVQIAEHLGGETFVYVSLPGGQTVTVEVQGQANIRPGERIGLSFADSAFHLFDAQEQVIPRRRAANAASPHPAAASTGT